MTMITGHHPLAFAFGLLGNAVSFMVYLAPLPTFYRVYKKKSTEGFQSVPYLVALFSAMLWLYYAFLKPNGSMLITINAIGCTIESIYIIMYLIYAPRGAKVLLIFNVGVFGAILLFTFLLAEGELRVTIVGWICSGFAVSVFAAPLGIMRLVIRTKSVEFMPLSLSFTLTLCAIMWFFYGVLMKDYYIALPNILGFAFGIGQMILYIIYKDGKNGIVSDLKLPEIVLDVLHNDAKIEPSTNKEEAIRMNQCNYDVKPAEPNDCKV
ncbi:hypothetical protein GIB67_013284 [Kingdonia uniflora]|uniref:Bidirectional sugar transporter SWEET n=1 Tax=Kingdonia uniflora TaxID=39325 RepID=A0A7J7N6L2_9MAGN|nr:hypothetical protein GIB67_013284 [Kingdonia uniflora]